MMDKLNRVTNYLVWGSFLAILAAALYRAFTTCKFQEHPEMVAVAAVLSVLVLALVVSKV